MLGTLTKGLLRLFAIPALAGACWILIWLGCLTLGIIDFPKG